MFGNFDDVGDEAADGLGAAEELAEMIGEMPLAEDSPLLESLHESLLEGGEELL